MRSIIAALRTLVLPFGAGPGQDRIVIDGTTGRIEIYQGGVLVAFVDPDDGFVASDGVVPFTAGEYAQLLAGTGELRVNNGADDAASIQASSSGGDPTLLVDSPRDGANSRARLTLKAAGNTGDSARFGTHTGGLIDDVFLGCSVLHVPDGANRSMGQATLAAGTVVVANTRVTANSRVFLSRATQGAGPGHLSYAINPGVSFTITSSSGADTGVVNWLIIDP